MAVCDNKAIITGAKQMCMENLIKAVLDTVVGGFEPALEAFQDELSATVLVKSL